MIQIKLKNILKAPFNYIARIFEILLENSRSRLLVVIDKNKQDNYVKNKKFILKDNLVMIKRFYSKELESYCAKNNLSIINELEHRKNELENNSSYYINIGIGVGTGLLATIISNGYIVWFNIIRRNTYNAIDIIKYCLVALLIPACIVLFLPLVRFIIHYLRKDMKGELLLLNQYELKMVNQILDRKTEEMLSIDK